MDRQETADVRHRSSAASAGVLEDDPAGAPNGTVASTPDADSVVRPDVSGALPEGEAEIELRGVSKLFTSRHRETLALTDINLGIRKEEFVTLVGQSGCGKTTMLRILAGLIKPTGGEVRIKDRPLWRGNTRDESALRQLGLVFQDANLFPWYTVEDNIGLPLALRKVDKKAASPACARARRARRTDGVRESASSGAVGRHAPARRHRARSELRPRDPAHGRAVRGARRDDARQDEHGAAAHRAATNATVVLVTHSIAEAVFLADRVVLLSARPGRIRSITEIPAKRPRQLEVTAEPGFQDRVVNLRHQLIEDEERVARHGGVSE